MPEALSEMISCVLIPLQGYYLILPNAAIAEAIPMPKLQVETSKPNYWIGNYNWNRHSIPVINLNQLLEGIASTTEDASKLCIIRAINSATTVNAYAFPTHGAPQLIQLNESALKLSSNTSQSKYIHCSIIIGNKTAIIPNLDMIETTIESSL